MPKDNGSADATGLSALAEVNEALAGGSSLRASLQRVLQLLDRQASVVCSSVTLLNPDSGMLHVEASEGLTPEGRSARYAIGEGVTGRVVESGKPVIVPRASKEPMFLNRARRKNLEKRDISFICVPILTRKQPVGAVSIDLTFEQGLDYQRFVRFLDVIATMIAQAIRVNHLVDGERQRLTEENVHLRGGTDTYARHAEELQFVRLQMQAKAKEAQGLADQLAFSKQGEAEKGRAYARLQGENKDLKEDLDETRAGLNQTEEQRLIALKDAAERQEIINLKEQDLNTIKDQMAERDKAITSLNTNIDGLKNQIGDLKSDFNTKITTTNHDGITFI